MTTTAYPPSRGGVQAHVEDLRRRLVRYEADVATLWLNSRTDWLLGTTLGLNEAKVGEVKPGLLRLGWTRTARLRMAPWVFAYYSMPEFAARRIAAQMVPFVARISQDYALVHNHRIGREFLALASLSVARQRGIPFVLTPHHHAKWRRYPYGGWLLVYRAADAVLTHTEAERRELERLGIPPERLTVIGGAADEPMPGDAERFRRQIGASDRPVVLFIGQLYAYKGVATLTKAVEALHARNLPVELVFIGPATRFSQRFFSQHRRPWLHVLGNVEPQTKWDALEAAELMCLPSRNEAFGRVYLEAWSKHKPVIGGRISAVSEVITDGETGFLVDVDSMDQLVGAIERIITDPGLAARMGAKGAREIELRFNWRRVVNRVEKVYDSLLQQ